MGGLFQPLSFDPRLADGRELEPKQMEMYWMASYDLDTFRRFVLESSFLDRFEVQPPENQTDSVQALHSTPHLLPWVTAVHDDH